MIRFLVYRSISIIVAVVLATSITIYVANWGGKLDQIILSQIEFEISQQVATNPAFRGLSEEEKAQYIRTQVELYKKALGFDSPFFPDRFFKYLWKYLTLDFGNAFFIHAKSGSLKVIDVIAERLPYTVILFTTATLLSALLGLFIAFIVSKKALTVLDKVITPLSFTTYVLPTWFMGIFAILIFAYTLKILPPGGMFSPGVPEEPLPRLIDFLWHLTLPLTAWIISTFGYWTYVFRSMLTQLYEEDFVKAAYARGLPPQMIDRRYVLRNVMPPFITLVSLSLVFSIAGAPITEYVFNWEGLGGLLLAAASVGDAPIVIGSTIIFAYLLAITVIILEIVYAIVDPRIRAERK
ncbi:ABC transporter permease [Pyrobaculum aerophilum]|uniref:ABC transporter permease n=1 Tax=Pyrobaculum aerophilum TaxID=13773 RepID=UPI0015F2827D|nr:ABC transporter permease [Pyrobaculum aerophilum]